MCVCVCVLLQGFQALSFVFSPLFSFVFYIAFLLDNLKIFFLNSINNHLKSQAFFQFIIKTPTITSEAPIIACHVRFSLNTIFETTSVIT